MEKYNFKIAGREIGYRNPVFIIAEISANHNQNFERAKKLVESACELGVDAIKLQTYTPDTLTINCSNKWFQVKTNPAWKGKTLYELYKTAYMPWKWQPKLKKIADKYGVILFSTPFDETAVDFLEKMNVPAYKIASFEIGDIELLKKVAKTKKPVIISRGLASLKELKLAISTLRKNGASEIAVLHCIISYPAKPEEMNLATISDIKKRFKVITGLSDHSLSIATAITSVALGASIIEKHFTLKRSEGGLDAAFSLESAEMKQLVQNVREAEKSIGKVHYGIDKGEVENIVFRRSLFVVEDIKKGEKFTRKNIRCIRPGYGLAPRFLSKIISRKAKKDIRRGTPLERNLIS
ncbi:MAG: pseudaminic acid synthase [Candidatus Staskawiczbacteria bacterium]|jgi:pseudaminic acid synthase